MKLSVRPAATSSISRTGHRGRLGAPPDGQQTHVSAYATMHPWEDFAETLANDLHFVDTLEMAAEFGMEVRPQVDRDGG